MGASAQAPAVTDAVSALLLRKSLDQSSDLVTRLLDGLGAAPLDPSRGGTLDVRA